MNEILDDASLRKLRDTAVDAGIHQPPSRDDLLYGIMPRLTASIPQRNAPRDQLLADLRELNRYVSLPDGSVPLLTWLENALDKTFGKAQEKTFLSFIEQLSVTTGTTNRPVDPKPLNGGNERIVHGNDMLDIVWLDRGRRVGASVAKLLVPRYVGEAAVNNAAGDHVTGSGTGWLLTKDLMITNHHVVNERADDEVAAEKDFLKQAANAKADFDYDGPNSNVTTIPVHGLVVADRGLDYALLRLSQAMSRPPLPLTNSLLAHQPGESISVNIIQHPNGKQKRIAIRNNIVHSSDANVVSYFTDTLRGSSGSPVCNDNWQVVALHRGWQPVVNINFQGKDTAYANYGTHILRILQHLRKHASAAVWEEIRQAHAPLLDNVAADGQLPPTS